MKNLRNLKTLGRVLFGLPFIIFGGRHILNVDALSGIVPSYIPFAGFWVVITGVIFIATGLAIVANKYTRTAALTLAAQLAVFVLLVHLPGLPGSTGSFLKDIGLLAAALMIAGIYKDEVPQ